MPVSLSTCFLSEDISLGGHYSHTLTPSGTIIGPRVAGGCVAAIVWR